MSGPVMKSASETSERPVGSFSGDVFKLVSGATFAQVLGVLAAPVLTRLFAPDAFGLMALFVSITAILGIVSCLRYEMAIPLPKKDGEAAALLAACVVTVIAVSSLIAILVHLLGERAAGWLNAPAFATVQWLLPVAVFLAGISQAFRYWNARMQRFGRISMAQAVNAASATSLKLGAGWAGWTGGASLISAVMAGQAVSAGMLGARIWRAEGAMIRLHARFREAWPLLRRYRKFPLADVWGVLINTASWQLPALLLASFFAQAVVGHYALGLRVLQLPMAMLGSSLGQVYYQRISRAWMAGETLDRLTGDVFARLSAVSLFPCMLIALAGPELFGFVFGSAWREAGVYAQILSPWIFLWFISSPLSMIYPALGRQGLALILNSAIFVTRFLALLIGGVRGDIYLALALFAGSGVVMYGILTLQIMHLAGTSWRIAIRALARPFGVAVPLALILFGVQQLGVTDGVTVMAAGGTLAAYFVVVVRTDHELYELLKKRIMGRAK